MIKTYYALTKPGIIYGNCLTAAGGFLLAADRHINFSLLLATLAGLALVIASGCVFNNYLDRGIDAKMARTKQRALVAGSVTGPDALVYATCLGLLGLVLLATYTNSLTAIIGAGAFLMYVVVYGVAKRRSVHGTLIGSLAGAAPPVMGYTAVTNNLDSGALLLFLILVCWQMPHFYAIAIYRLKDYQAASIPVLPAVKGLAATEMQIKSYIMAFIATTTLLTISGHASYSFAVMVLLVGLVWLHKAYRSRPVVDTAKWARQMFGFSLVVMLTLSAMLALSPLLP